MRYISQQDIRQAIPERSLRQLSNDDPAASEPDWDVVEQLAVAAEEIVDGFLRARYVLPLDPVPTVIRELTLNLVRYRLYSRRPEGISLPETVKDLNKDAMSVLEMIQAGKVTLGSALDAKPVGEPGRMRVKASRARIDVQALGMWRGDD